MDVNIPKPEMLPTRRELAVSDSHYGVFLTTTAERLQLAGTVRWRSGLQLYASVYGSRREGDEIVAFIVFQDFRQVASNDLPAFVLARPGHVTAIPLSPREPVNKRESLRVLIVTHPERLLAPRGVYDRNTAFISVASQKAYVVRD